MGSDAVITFADSLDNLGKDTRNEWEFVLATGVVSEMKVLSFGEHYNLIEERTSKALKLAVQYKESPHVLNSIADFLDFCFRYMFLLVFLICLCMVTGLGWVSCIKWTPFSNIS